MNRVLHDAARKGDLSELRVLLQNGADIDEIGPHSWPLLIAAAHSGNAETVGWLLEHGVNREATDRDGKNVLHHAAMRGCIEVVRLLLDRGFAPEVRDRSGNFTPIHLASSHAPRDTVIETIALFLERGHVDIDARNIWGQTALMNATFGGKNALIKFLLDSGAGIDVQAEDGTTALIAAARWGLSNGEVVRLLLQRGACVNVGDVAGRTALMRAATEANADVISILLEYGASINLQDAEGRTALIHASGPAPQASVIGILSRERNPTEADRNGKNRQRVQSAWQARAKTVRVLLENNADPTICDFNGKSALDWALDQEGNEAVVDVLRGNPASQ